MILTYKVKHGGDFARELALAKKVAEFALTTTSWSSAQVKHIGLKSVIACQILKKYSRDKKIKSVKSVKLTVPSRGVKVELPVLFIPCLKLTLPVFFDKSFTKVNQVEVGEVYAYISVSYNEPPMVKSDVIIGVDRNTKHHVVVASNLTTGKVLKLGKSCSHVHNKYRDIRRNLQKQRKFRLTKRIKNRESCIVRNLNHHVSKKLVLTAKESNATLVLEQLSGIRKTAKCKRSFRYSLNSWSFYQLEQMIEYKAKKFGVPVVYVEPQYTSQRCCCCGHVDEKNRVKNLFRCLKCGRVEDSGANAGFNIGCLHLEGIPRFSKDSDLLKGNTDVPREAML